MLVKIKRIFKTNSNKIWYFLKTRLLVGSSELNRIIIIFPIWLRLADIVLYILIANIELTQLEGSYQQNAWKCRRLRKHLKSKKTTNAFKDIQKRSVSCPSASLPFSVQYMFVWSLTRKSQQNYGIEFVLKTHICI